MSAVSNSSPLILYARIGRLNLLHDVFDQILIPPAVWHEVVTAGGGRAGAAEVAQALWISRRSLADGVLAARLFAEVDPGEAEAIALTLHMTDAPVVLLDDLKARHIARDHGLSVVGSAGVLGLAKDLGLISAVKPLLDDLRAAGLYLSHAAMSEFLTIYSENDSGEAYR